MRRFSLAAILACAVLHSGAQEPKPTFEVASVRPQARPMTFADLSTASPRVRPGGLFTGTHATVLSLIMFAYDLKDYQIDGGPDWARQAYFDVTARAASDAPEEQIRRMVQSLLEERFGLVIRMEQREMDYLELVLARSDGRLGPYIARVDGECDRAAADQVREQFPPRPQWTGGGSMSGQCAPLGGMADMLSRTMNVPVFDRTGLSGRWVYAARYAPDMPPGVDAGTAADPAFPRFEIALEEQLGLKLQPGRGPVDLIVIESVQQPTEN